MISKEETVVTKIVNSMLNNGAVDEIVVAILETALEDNLREMRGLSEELSLTTVQYQDYLHHAQFAKAAITVLRYFTINLYTEAEDELRELIEEHLVGVDL